VLEIDRQTCRQRKTERNSQRHTERSRQTKRFKAAQREKQRQTRYREGDREGVVWVFFISTIINKYTWLF